MIRAAVPSDAQAVAEVYSAYVLDGVATFEEVPPNSAEMGDRLANGLPWLVAERSGEVVGYAYAAPHHVRAGYRWSVNTSVYLRADATGQGLGQALYAELLPLLGRLGYVNALAGIALPNPASVALHESCGFRPVGVYEHIGFKHGRWIDVGWWQLALQEPPAGPAEPVRRG